MADSFFPINSCFDQIYRSKRVADSESGSLFCSPVFIILFNSEERIIYTTIICIWLLRFFFYDTIHRGITALFNIAGVLPFTKRRFGFIFGCIMGIAVTVKSIAAMLYFAVFIGMCVLWHAHKLKFLDIIRTYIPATIISCLYPFYLQVTFGSWKSFIDCQYDYWKRMKINPVQELYIQLKTIFGNIEGNCVLFRINEALSLTIVCFILYEIYCYIRSYKTRQNDLSDMLVLILYVLFSLAAINATIRIPSYNAPTTSFYRYYYSLFPIYLLAENMSQKKKNVVYACSTAISFITAIIFIKNCYFY